jgi:hypothetical protein
MKTLVVGNCRVTCKNRLYRWLRNAMKKTETTTKKEKES